MNQIPDILEYLREVVKKTADNLGTHIYYTYGSGDDITQELIKLSGDKNLSRLKYPLIGVFTDLPLRMINDAYAEASISLVVATLSNNMDSTRKRNQLTFAKILRPIWLEFFKNITAANFVVVNDFISYNYTEKFSYARQQLLNDGQGGIDFIDAILIENLKINIKLNKNC